MVKTNNDYVTVEMDDDFVVFLTGMRINKWWKFWKWIPVFAAMPRMCRELHARPELGMLHYRYHPGLTSMMVVMYWKSFEHLRAYAADQSCAHIPAWRALNKAVGTNGDVGTWHETYLVKKSDYECLYVNMPDHGLGNVGRQMIAKGKMRTARGRLGQGSDDWTDLNV